MKLYSGYKWSRRFKFTIFTIGKLGVVIHFFLIFFFLIVDVKEMAIYNMFSSAFFATMLYLIKKEVSVKLIFFITCFEVVLHAYLGTYYLGSECNFIFFIFILPSVFLLNPKWKVWESSTFFLSIVFLYLFNIFLFKDHEAVYKLNEYLIFYTGIALILIVVFMIFLVVFYYSHLVNTNDKALRKVNKALKIKNEEKQLIIKEIHHRIKNNLQVVISLLRLQASKVDDEKVVDMFKNTQKRIFSMALLHESLLQENDLELINANDHFKYLTENLINSYAVDKEINIEIDIENINFGMQTLTPLGLIINEVITNSLKHAFNETKQGEIRISMRKLHDKKHEIQIADNGSGYIKKSESKGVGTRLVSIFVKQLNGTLELLEHQGTAYRIIFDEIEHT